MVKLSENKARQGRRGLPVLIILLVSLILAMVVWWGVELYGTAIAPEENGVETGVDDGGAANGGTQPPPAAD
ncbi:MAG TPA: hypothetical protein PL183_02360 [Aquamicrobium sp.]|nr:hypothetical protein [Aquamicrobium sp.]